MKKIIGSALAGTLGLVIAFGISAGPVEDQIAFQKYYENRFPDTPTEDFANGVYSILPTAREQWEAIEEFPPYELAIEAGEEFYHKTFANGKSLRIALVRMVQCVISTLSGIVNVEWS